MYCDLSYGEDVQECPLKHNDFCFVAVISSAGQCATGIFHLCNIFSKGKARIISFAVGNFAYRPIKDQLSWEYINAFCFQGRLHDSTPAQDKVKYLKKVILLRKREILFPILPRI